MLSALALPLEAKYFMCTHFSQKWGNINIYLSPVMKQNNINLNRLCAQRTKLKIALPLDP